MHVPAELKVRCTFYTGAAETRGSCVHELQVLNEIASRSRYMELTGVEEDVESGVGKPAVSTGSPDQLKPKAYALTCTRRFFSSASEENAVLRIIIEAKECLLKGGRLKGEILVKLQDTLLFLGILSERVYLRELHSFRL